MTIRNERIVKGIDYANGVGLELGPLTSPILSKQEATIYYLDHMSVEEMKVKYKDEPVDLDKIVPIDFVLSKNGLKASVGNKRFDYVLASHVIEHIPNVVGWLQEVYSILKPHGVLSLVVPDKRFTFDIQRRTSSPAEIIGAHIDDIQRFSSTMMYDFASQYVADVDSGEAWRQPEKVLSQPRRYTLDETYAMCKQNLDPEKYVDCHCFTFTPLSFLEVMRRLMEHGLLDYEIAHVLPTYPGELEFYVTLRKIDRKKVSLKKQLKSIPQLTLEPNPLAELKEENIILKQEIEALKGSVSWRATKGLRAARSILRKN